MTLEMGTVRMQMSPNRLIMPTPRENLIGSADVYRGCLTFDHLRFIHLNDTLGALVPLVPVIVERIRVKWQYNVVRDQIASGQRDTQPTHQCHAKNPSVESQY